MGMAKLARRALLAAALAVVALAPAAAQTASSADDMIIGAANAPVTLLEYGSAACGHCRAFEQASWETLKREYIDRGRVRFIFREALAPVSPDGSGVIESITLAMYQVSRCESASPQQYFTRLGVFFDRQPAIFRSANMAAVLEHIVTVGVEAGLTREQVAACINDPAGSARIQRLGAAADRDQLRGTPMFFLNGRPVETEPMMTPAGLRQVLDGAIAVRR